jgi:hypothetical protein
MPCEKRNGKKRDKVRTERRKDKCAMNEGMDGGLVSFPVL